MRRKYWRVFSSLQANGVTTTMLILCCPSGRGGTRIWFRGGGRKNFFPELNIEWIMEWNREWTKSIIGWELRAIFGSIKFKGHPPPQMSNSQSFPAKLLQQIAEYFYSNFHEYFYSNRWISIFIGTYRFDSISSRGDSSGLRDEQEQKNTSENSSESNLIGIAPTDTYLLYAASFRYVMLCCARQM